ncbi:hypothetical protein B0E42_02160 [Pseudomonas sp. A25(2017)]|uniref:helix-turn-helix domain-containing protein n=1 Tax=Pseudomonas TaxID=286 RepID=UPI0009D53898|nr:hypothetical protein B0E42_02160 [Pseudomonas sp. A25(2017)]
MKAKDLLREGELSIENIVEGLGFSNSASLRCAFRRWLGHSPKTQELVAHTWIDQDASHWFRRDIGSKHDADNYSCITTVCYPSWGSSFNDSG